MRRRFSGWSHKTFGFKKFLECMKSIEGILTTKRGVDYIELEDKSTLRPGSVQVFQEIEGRGWKRGEQGWRGRGRGRGHGSYGGHGGLQIYNPAQSAVAGYDATQA